MSDDCYHKAKKNNEPTFTIRAQDKTSPAVIAKWIVSNIYTAPDDKLIDALRVALEMRNWPKNKTKAAD